MENGWILATFALSAACSYFALGMTSRSVFKERTFQLFLIFKGAALMGTGAWAMHYFAILVSPFGSMDATYNTSLVMISLFVPILSSFAALVCVSSHLPEGIRSFVAAVVLTMGVSSLHFIGMSAMRMNAVLAYDQTLLFCSILFALATGYAAFRLYIFERYKRMRYRLLWSALLLGVSLFGMHILAVESTTVIPIAVRGVFPEVGMTELGLRRTVAIGLSAAVALTFPAFRFARRIAERMEQLEEQRLLYCRIFDRASDAILILRPDPAQTIVEVNDRACELLGLGRKELLGAPLGQVVSERSRRAEYGPEGEGWEEWKMAPPNGGPQRLAEVNMSAIAIDGHRMYRAAYLRDVTGVKTKQAIADLYKPLSVLAVSGMPPALLLAMLRHLTTALFPNGELRCEPASGTPAFEAEPDRLPRTREVRSWDGTGVGRLTFTRMQEPSAAVLSRAEEMWLEKCADLFEISCSTEQAAAMDDGGCDTWAGLLDKELKFVFATRTVSGLLDYTSEELPGRSLLELFHPEDANQFLLRVRQAEDLKTPYRFFARLLHKEGEWVRMNVLLASAQQEEAKVVLMAQQTSGFEPAPRADEAREDGGEESGEAQETKLTRREKEVIALINRGKSNKEIAQELSISENTVKNHISNIFAKLGIGDRSQVPVVTPDIAD